MITEINQEMSAQMHAALVITITLHVATCSCVKTSGKYWFLLAHLTIVLKHLTRSPGASRAWTVPASNKGSLALMRYLLPLHSMDH